MTKSEMLNALAEKLGKTRKEVSEIMDVIVAMAHEETKKSGEFTIPGLGKLVKKDRKERMGRNPATGDDKDSCKSRAQVSRSQGRKRGYPLMEFRSDLGRNGFFHNNLIFKGEFPLLLYCGGTLVC